MCVDGILSDIDKNKGTQPWGVSSQDPMISREESAAKVQLLLRAKSGDSIVSTRSNEFKNKSK